MLGRAPFGFERQFTFRIGSVMRAPVSWIVAIFACVGSWTVGHAKIALAAESRPTPPRPSAAIAVPKPAAESPAIQNTDLRQLDPIRLRSGAQKLAAAGNFAEAAQLQYFVCERMNDGRYDLAGFYSRGGAADKAIYWLLTAAQTDGVDAKWAAKDPNFAPLHKNSRWPGIVSYLETCSAYWSKHGTPTTPLLLPSDYDVRTDPPLWGVVWLHGLSGNPNGFVNPANVECQNFANTLPAAFIGVSATVAGGPRKYSWTEDVNRDLPRIQAALAEVKSRVRLRPQGLILFGFSQGAQVGVEIAVRKPEEFAGCIALSPGGMTNSRLPDLAARSPLLASRGFVFGCGDGEHQSNKNRTADGAQWTKSAGAKIQLVVFPNQNQHSFPADFTAQFPNWVRFVQDAQNRPATPK